MKKLDGQLDLSKQPEQVVPVPVASEVVHNTPVVSEIPDIDNLEPYVPIERRPWRENLPLEHHKEAGVGGIALARTSLHKPSEIRQ